VPNAPDPALAKLATYFTWSHGVVLFQLLTYFLAGRAVYALVAGRAIAGIRSRYTAAYVALGSLTWHFLAFVILFAGVRSLLTAHLIAAVPFALICIIRRRHVFAFNRGWALFALVLIGIAFARPGTPLLQADAQVWDEFTHWASRAKQIFVYDRLPTGDDPAGCVAPYYGLFATLMAVWNYVLQGREAVGGGIAWSLLFTIFVSIHAYEFSRVNGIPRLIAGPMCTWFLASMLRGQSIITMTMYADIFVVFGGMLALFHLTALAFDADARAGRAEDLLLAATGLGILVFTKTTGDVIAACAVGYAAIAIAIVRARESAYGDIFRRWAWVLLAALPAMVIRGVWTLYLHFHAPSSARLLLEQGLPSDEIAHMPRTAWYELSRALLEGLLRAPPYSVLLAALPFAWVFDIALGRSGRSLLDRRVGITAAWAPLVFVCFLVVFNCTYGAHGAQHDAQRYMAAILPAMLCYHASVINRLVVWAVRYDRGSAQALPEITSDARSN